MPPHVEASVWRGSELGGQPGTVIGSGWDALDLELPGSGWPCQAISEVLTPQPSVVEWRLLSPVLRRVVADGGQLVVVAPPRHPYLPGLIHDGFDERRFVWVQAEGPAERLWVTEQLIKSSAFGAIVAWLPQARQEQIRRLQVCAQSASGPVFLCRPESAQHEASAAPLRVQATFGLDWELQVRILKRRGPSSDQLIALPSVPGGLASVITPRLRKPSRLLSREVAADAVGSSVVSPLARRHAASH
ncbi:MAG: translesion DNA synthesis-associated protein ImuA [Piscinibacter sp.]